jgi:hypothetical protein
MFGHVFKEEIVGIRILIAPETLLEHLYIAVRTMAAVYIFKSTDQILLLCVFYQDRSRKEAEYLHLYVQSSLGKQASQTRHCIHRNNLVI